jgi:hypothetical protein
MKSTDALQLQFPGFPDAREAYLKDRVALACLLLGKYYTDFRSAYLHAHLNGANNQWSALRLWYESAVLEAHPYMTFSEIGVLFNDAELGIGIEDNEWRKGL